MHVYLAVKRNELVLDTPTGIDLKHPGEWRKKIKEVFNSQSVKLSVCLCIVSRKATAWVTACGGAEAMLGLINDPQPIHLGSSFDLTWLRMEWEPMDSVCNR